MRNGFEVHGWKVTPAVCRSTYVGKDETMTVTKVARGKGADGYHVATPTGAAFYVQYWDDDKSWTSATRQSLSRGSSRRFARSSASVTWNLNSGSPSPGG